MKMSREKPFEVVGGAAQAQPEAYPQWKLDVEKVLDKLASEGHLLGWVRKHGFYNGGWAFHNAHKDGVTTYIPNLSRDVPWALNSMPKEALPMVLATGDLGNERILNSVGLLYLKRYCEMVLSGEIKHEN